VMTGSVLEERLRQLCGKAGIETTYLKDGVQRPKKADLLNSELAKQSVYKAIDQKQVTAWLAIRNDAAHGHYWVIAAAIGTTGYKAAPTLRGF